MDLSTLLRTRYSTKQFDPSYKLSKEELNQIKDLLRLSPSSVNLQPWHFILAESEEAKKRVAKGTEGDLSFNKDKILHSALSVVFCVRTDLEDAYLEELLECEHKEGRYLQQESMEAYKRARHFFSDLHRKTFNDVDHWMEKQLYLNVGMFLLGVAVMGLDAVPMEGIDPHALNSEFGLLEKGVRASLIVAVGRRSEDDFNAKLPKSRWPEEKVFTLLDD